MTILEPIIYGGLVAVIIVGVTVTFMPVDHKVTPSISKTKYIEEPYTTADGTPCTVLRSRSGPYVGVTCNYDATPPPRK
jgi:hypothetical protein